VLYHTGHTGAMGLMYTVWDPPIICLLVDIHPMVGHSMVMVLSLGRVVVVSHGVEAVAGPLVAGEASVVGGGNAWGSHDGERGSISTTG
jgi:hypothetical protein